MGEIDKKTKEYLSHKDIFADVCNYALYDGSQVIKPDDLSELDPESVRLANLLTGSKLKISDKGGNKTMCKAIDDMIADSRAEGMAEGIAQGKAEGIAQGKAEGRESALRDNIGSMVEALHITVMQAMDILKIPENERYKFL